MAEHVIVGGTVPSPVNGRLRKFLQLRSAQRLLRNRAVVFSVVLLVLIIVCAIAAPALAPFDPNAQRLSDRLQGPGTAHLLGTDSLGRDILSRLLFGARVSLLGAAEATLVALVLGIPPGLVAGLAGRWIDACLRTIAEVVLSVPPLLLSIVIVGVMGASLRNAMISIGVVVAPRYFRVARSAAYSVRRETYIESSRAIGCSPFRVLWRHVLPNASGPLLVQTSFVVGLAIVAEASLSFLGLGVQPPQASWGSMTQEAYRTLTQSTWGIVPPATMMVLTVLAFSLLGDGLRDAFGRESGRR